jgi:hypothetical protein
LSSATYTAPSSSQPCHIPIVHNFREAFIDTLCFRYGFLCDDNNEWDGVEDGEIAEITDVTLYHVKRIFIAHHDELPPRYHRRFLAFAAMLVTGHTDPQLWDLDPSSPRRLLPPPTLNNDVLSINCLCDMVG